MVNPTFTALSVVLGGDTEHAIAASASGGTLTVKVPYAKRDLLASAGLIVTASAADTYFYTSTTTGATSTVKVGTTATTLTGTFDITEGLTIAASAAGTLTADNHSDYTVAIVLTNKVIVGNNFAIGLGNVVAVDITNYDYSSNASTGGIPLKIESPVQGILSATFMSSSGGPYTLCYFDKATQKLRVYSAAGSELNSVLVSGTLLLLKQ